MSRSRRSTLLLPLAVGVCSILGGFLGPRVTGSAAAASDDELRAGLRSFVRVLELVETNAADKLDQDKAVYKGAIPGALRTLDPHSSFFDPRDFQLLREDQNGRYFGVGMMVGSQGGKVTVIHPFSGAPAYKAGIRPADVIVAVDDKPTEGLSLTEVVERLKGPRGTRVKIGILREGSDQPLSFEMQRDEISRRSVNTAFLVRPRIGYVHIESFNENTSREFDQSLRKLNDRELEGLVLDLRGNPGGLLNEGVAVADRFLKRGQVIVSHRGRNSAEKPYLATRNGSGREYPVVVLVNRYSASAAEIVAGALQDHDRAWILGESTFGKGLVQSQFPLAENTALLLTTARYYTPSGRLIQRDYEHTSFLEYYTRKEGEPAPSKDVKMTDSGREVRGGGGISPDEKYTLPKLKKLESRLLGRNAFFQFTSSYFATREAKLPRTFKPDAGVLSEFRAFLRKKEIPFTEAEFTESQSFIEERLRLEMYTTAFSKEEADQLAIELDPEVERAVDALPKAKALLDKSRELMVRRAAGPR
ncbi:MAG: S41 family peptidase [Acidobacteria bacterium]|nr:S41 family peptidase [Acidobacteriota bacterium]